MTRTLRLRLEAVNPMAVLAIAVLTLFGLTGDVPAETVITGVLAIAVPGHSKAAPPD